jgi:lipid A 3-O-deacylase
MAMHRHRTAAVLMVAFALLSTAVAVRGAPGQVAQSVAGDPSVRPAENLLAGKPWEFGPFVDGGFGTGNREAYTFLWVGVHAGKVLTDPAGKGFLNGQFELGAEFMPLWQAYTPKYLRAN